ncbi:MAG: type II toxin-antitoxin system RelE/ParE family toxin [Deltaproteobacteria bacterium]|nr:type II toxin-antitoxin system RelE/ParE family toxin [Deltaproteobacteria bacterium]
MKYELLIERRAQRALAKIVKPSQDRIISAIRRLADDPRPAGVKKLSGRDALRIRVGSYRVIYEINDAKLVALVVDVGDRRDVYR